MRKGKRGKKSKTTGKTTSKNVPTRNVFVDDEIFEDDGELDPEDLEYFQDSGRSFAFLQQVEAELPSSGKKRKRKQTADEEREADYEKKPRTAPLEQDHKERALLPIKTKDSVIQRKEKILKTGHSLQNGGVDSEEQALEVSPVPSAPPPVLSMVELFNQRRQKLIQRKHRIAELSNSILENPEGSVSAPLVVSELQELCSMCYEKEADIRITTKKLAMVSLLTVFKDIIPGYPIRTASEKEQGVKLSKEVKKLRDYEQGLLKNYQKYLQILEETVQECVKTQKRSSKNGLIDKKSSSESLMLVTVQCMCDLLTSVPHFNFHTNLIAVLVPRMNEKSLDGEISELCSNAFISLFKQDTVGSVSLEAVRVISKFVKSKGFRVQPSVLETFLHLRISQIDIQSLKQHNEKKSAVELKIEKNKNRMEKKLKGKISKKEKKRKREMKKLEKEMQETEAVESQQKRAKLQTEILKFVFVTYFRVLKTVGHSPLLSPVLEGLAKFAHLINVDFFNDLMGALRTLLDNKIPHITCQGEALNIDPREFYRMLYLSLLQVHAMRRSLKITHKESCVEGTLAEVTKELNPDDAFYLGDLQDYPVDSATLYQSQSKVLAGPRIGVISRSQPESCPALLAKKFFAMMKVSKSCMGGADGRVTKGEEHAKMNIDQVY
ncbi:Nucleolar complex protein 3-like [Stylophora pistillata]|uniref:Nucleolar complex protein 3-like n=1 Tax=Stylophora pistillata TaxID=50429 RepID=A0A2B4SQB4_STYPI|nr:Nucleolar complex protein 3-like [Stylophora pistillata]